MGKWEVQVYIPALENSFGIGVFWAEEIYCGYSEEWVWIGVCIPICPFIFPSVQEGEGSKSESSKASVESSGFKTYDSGTFPVLNYSPGYECGRDFTKFEFWQILIPIAMW